MREYDVARGRFAVEFALFKSSRQTVYGVEYQLIYFWLFHSIKVSI